jgi:curved DNA-binding protein CbpA
MRRSVSGVAEPCVRDDPFALLGLPARASLSDEDVRAAWRRIAAATHPDREDGGDPARFGAAAAAYVTLRTSFGRGEALADLGGYLTATESARRPGRHRGRRGRVRRQPVTPGLGAGAVPGGRGARLGAGLATGAAAAIVAGGRGRGLIVRAVAAGAASAAAFLAAGWSPGTAGVLAGAATWLVIAWLRG